MATPASEAQPGRQTKRRKSSDVLDQVHREKSSEVLAQLHRSFSAADEEKDERCIVDSNWFNSAINICIGLNALQLGIEADHPELSSLWFLTENFFTGAFFIEMVIKVSVLKWQYFEEKANWLDALLTIFGVLDVWILALIPGDSVDLQSMSILRVLRLARLGRVLRLARRVKQIVLVMSGVVQALATTFWVFLLLIFVIYVCAIFCTEYIGHGDADVYPGYAKEEALIDEQEIMMNFNPYLSFGDMKSSMLTLFNIAIGGEWAEIVRPLAVKQPWLVLLFGMYNMLMAFGLMNVMMAIIVDSVIDESKKLDEEMKEMHKAKQRKLLQEIENFFVELDTNKDSDLDAEELNKGFEIKSFRELLAQTDLPAGWTAKELLFMLDDSGDGVLQKSEFMSSFYRLMDSNAFQGICILQAGINQVKNLVRRAHDKLDIEIDEVRGMLYDLHAVGIGTCRPPLRHHKSDYFEHEGNFSHQISSSQKSDGAHCDHKEALHCQPQEQCITQSRELERSQEPKRKTLLSASVRDLIKSSHEQAVQQDTPDNHSAPPEDTSKKCASYDEVGEKAHTDFGRNTDKDQVNKQSDLAPSPALIEVSSDLHPPEACKASDCLSHAKHDNQGDVTQGFAQDPIKAQEPRADTKSKLFKPIIDLLDDSFLAMKDALCRELAMLMQAEVMSAISGTGEAAVRTDTIASVKCGNLAEGNFYVGQQPEASGSVSAEAIASSCSPKPMEDVKQATVLHSCQSADQTSSPIWTHSNGECYWQELDAQPTLTLTSSKLQAHANRGCVNTAVEDVEHLGSVIHAPTLQEHANVGSSPTTQEIVASAVSGNDGSHVRLELIPDCDFQSRDIAVEDGEELGFVDIAVEDGETLGFEIHWCPSQFPLVGKVSPGSASDLCGVLQGDRIMQCNGISLCNKSRHEILPLLKLRPLLLRLQRNPGSR